PNQVAKPAPISTQNSLFLPRVRKTLGKQESTADRRSSDWRMSLTAMRAKPRRASREAATWSSTRHTNPIPHAFGREDIHPSPAAILGRLLRTEILRP